MNIMTQRFMQYRCYPSIYSISIAEIEKEIEDNNRVCKRLMRTMWATQDLSLASFVSGILATRKQYARDLSKLIVLRTSLIEAGF